jgi:hypothetical protein
LELAFPVAFNVALLFARLPFRIQAALTSIRALRVELNLLDFATLFVS